MWTYQGAFSRFRFFDMNQVAKGNANKIRCDPTIRLDIHKVRITTSVWILFKPKNETGKKAKRDLLV